MKFEKTEVWGFEHAIRGMRNPLESWGKSDSGFCRDLDCDNCSRDRFKESECGRVRRNDFVIGKNDLELMQKLICAGSEHRKFMRQIFVSVDITAPLYWWKEFSTYKIGTVANSTSTMHKLASTEITMDCFECGDFENFEFFGRDIFGVSCKKDVSSVWEHIIKSCEDLRQNYIKTKDKRYWKELIRLLPESWLQTRTITMNYENIFNMVHQRRNHKLSEWSVDFISWARSLPYAQELCFELEEKKYSIVSGGFDPLHKGHIELIKDAAKISKDGVIVIMNSDEWLRERKHRPLLQRESREAVLRSIKGVVDVIYDDFDVDGTVKVALSKIREKYPMAQLSFCNGGDRSEYKDVPESCLCESLDIDLCFGVGGREKIESSSSILEKYKKGE